MNINEPIDPEWDVIYQTAEEYGITPKRVDWFNETYPNGKPIRIEVRIPKHAGMFMCKSVFNTDSMVRWNLKTDNLADTLEGSIEKFLKRIGE